MTDAAGGVSRRGFVRLLGGAAGVGLVPWNFGCAVREEIRDSTHLATPGDPLTPIDNFYVRSNFGRPDDIRSSARWRLRLDGLVGRERTLGYDELLALPSVTREITVECIGNTPGGRLISSSTFTGALLRDVLALASPSRHALGVRMLGLDGYVTLYPTDVAASDGPMLVHTMGGEPLRPEHGAPVRALFPDRWGMFSMKWLDSITLTRQWSSWGTFRGTGNFIEGIRPPRSRIDGPIDRQSLPMGREIVLSGLALTAGVGVSRVEVELDGVWQPADLTFNTLTDERSALLWSFWSARWTPTRAGWQTLRVRAFDLDGVGQSADPGFPYDASAIHTIRVRVTP